MSKINKRVRNNEMEEACHFDDKVIVIPPSILKNKLYNLRSTVQNKYRIISSIATAIMSVAILVTVPANSYQKIFGISGPAWQAIFFLILAVSIIIAIYSIILLTIKWFKKEIITLDNLMDNLIKNNKLSIIEKLARKIRRKR